MDRKLAEQTLELTMREDPEIAKTEDLDTLDIGEKTVRQSEMSSSLRAVLPSDYELLEEIARGGMGVVYKARQISLDRMVAVKTILSGELATETQIQRFQIEARAAASLSHPRIVPVFQVGEHNSQHFLAMAYIEGESLWKRLQRAGPIDPRLAAALVEQICGAIEYAHSCDVIHRDIKPENILLSSEGIPYVTDFGLAKTTANNEHELTETGDILGTPAYMAPEQALGGKVDVRTDVYALGAVLYACLTARPPFQAANKLDILYSVREQQPIAPSKLLAKLDRDLETICLKCLEKEKEDRYQDVLSLLEDLKRYLGDKPILARPTGVITSAWRWYTGRSDSAVIVAGAYALIVGAYLLVCNFLGLFHVALQDRYEGFRPRAFSEIIVSIVLQCIPTIVVGYCTLLRTRGSLVLGTAQSIISSFFTFLLWLGVIEIVAQDQKLPQNALATFLLTLALFGTAFYGIAVYSAYKTRALNPN